MLAKIFGRQLYLYLVLLGLGIVTACRDEPNVVRSNLLAGAVQQEGFLRADAPMTFHFPQDHGPHPDFQTEWWYFTGNLTATTGRHFGYQLTIFRRALLPAAERIARESAWAADQIYMGHLALTDVDGGEFHAYEKFTRGSAGLAGAMANPFRVWLEDWSIEEINDGVYRLVANQDGLGLDVTLTDTKGPSLHGDQGYSQKGNEPGNASFYYSLTRLKTSGRVYVHDEIVQVNGESWMDHEFSSNALSEDQIGWDWFSIQLDDGSELMVYTIRREDGSLDGFSSGSWISPDGGVTRLHVDDYLIESNDRWRSPHSGATYPVDWTIRVPQLGLTLTLEPYLLDQELNLSYSYWEGAVAVTGMREDRQVSGQGYVEMTGYAGSMQGQF